jgi:formate dehydrogenase major subunit
MPNTYPGYQDVQNDEIRAKFEKAWKTDLPGEPGMTNHGMVDAMHEGSLRALYLHGEDMGIVDANANYVQRGFEKLDFFVVQDLFLSRTSEFADVILPAVPSLEKEGTFTNTERRIQRIYPALPTLGDAKPDWEIVQMLANELGADWSYTGPSAVMDEVASLTPMFAGVSYERLEGYKSLIWPVDEEGIDMPMLYEKEFHFEDGKAQLYFVDWTEPTGTDEEYDLHVNSGRLLEHFHEGNMTYKSEGITRKTPRAFIEVSPDLAGDRGIKDGTLVKLTSRTGSVKGRVVVTDRVKGNELYIPLNDNGELAVNKLTSSEIDKDTDTPAYKDTSVYMEVLEEKGERPLPSNNHRFGNRNPQIGIRIEDKWKRDDYVFPGNIVRKKEVKK